MIVGGLTGPFSILFAPLFAWRAWHRGSRSSYRLAALAVVVGGVQAWTVWRHPPAEQTTPIVAEALLAVPGMRVAGSLLVGALVPANYPRVVEIVLGGLTLGGIVTLARRRGSDQLERVWLGLAFLALLAGALFRCRAVLPDLCHLGFGSRYFYPLQLIVIWLMLTATSDPRRWVSRGATVLLLWSFAINVPRLREYPLADLHWADYATKIRVGAAVTIPVNPVPWTMTLPERKFRN